MSEQEEYTRRWSKEVERHRRQLLFIYRSKIKFPEAPFEPDEITSYIHDIRPYLVRSIWIKRIVMLITVSMIIAAVIQYDRMQQKKLYERLVRVQERAKLIGWNFDIEDARYEIDLVDLREQKYKRLLFHIQQGKTYAESEELLAFEDKFWFSTVFITGSGQNPVPNDYYMMQYEVTQVLYEEIMGYNPSSNTKCRSECPVERVSWNDVTQFANTLNEKLGLKPCYDIKTVRIGIQNPKPQVLWKDKECTGWRLPTDAEWIYAARGGEYFTYAGSDNVEEVAWTGYGEPKPVGTKKPNGYGLYDMSGNVSEWVWDIYPQEKRYTYRMTRNGSSYEVVSSSELSQQGFSWPFDSTYSRGFRLVRNVQ